MISLKRNELFKLFKTGFEQINIQTIENPSGELTEMDIMDSQETWQLKEYYVSKRKWIDAARLYEMKACLDRNVMISIDYYGFEKMMITHAEYWITALLYAESGMIAYARSLLKSHQVQSEIIWNDIKEDPSEFSDWTHALWHEFQGDMYALIDIEQSLRFHELAKSLQQPLIEENEQAETYNAYWIHYHELYQHTLESILEQPIQIPYDSPQRIEYKMMLAQQIHTRYGMKK